jgi:nitrogen fixation NifU-like protein
VNIYQLEILENYKNPKNSGKPSWKPTHYFKLENLSCGDSVEVFLLVEDSVIKDFKFIAEGCSIAIASASILSQNIIGMTLKELKKFTIEDFMTILGIELSPTRQKCAYLALEAVNKALE